MKHQHHARRSSPSISLFARSLAPSTRRVATAMLAAAAIAACGSADAPPAEKTGTVALAVGVTGLFPTGVDNNGTPLANGTVDPHYSLATTDVTVGLMPKAYAVAAQMSMGGGGAWTPNTPSSKWISVRPSAADALPLVYTYSTTFNLNGVDPTTATLTGSLACDDTCVLRLNGTTIKTFASPAWTTPAAFSIPAGGPFTAGMNTLSVAVTNSGGVVTGLQILTLTPGCTIDSECASSQFCNTQTSTCTAKLPDGTPVPTIAGHTPPLTGSCTTDVGTAVCVSGTCNTTTKDCGPASTTPTCTMDSQCTSTQFCDTQTMACASKLPDGTPIPTLTGHAPPLTGMCASGVGASVCVSGMCNMTSNACGPGCTMDSDCASTQFCDTQTSTCASKLPNGDMIPTITGHTPDLTGMCTTAVGASVCASGVCDTSDSECGLANGDGPCTTANGGTVCQSGVCEAGDAADAGGTCGPGATCTTDGDCTSAQFCNTQTSTCTAKLPSGTPIPTLGDHTPPLTGMCTTDVGAAVCVAAVCDPSNNECGLANGTGPCTAANGATVCQSGVCNAAGTCGPGQKCTTDSDCTNPLAPVCDPTTMLCVPEQDGGAGDSGTNVAGDDGGDAGVAPGDAGTQSRGDGGDGDGGKDRSGFVEGGGCATAPGGERGSAGILVLAGIVALGFRRRRG
ncbi:MAG TPA: hypothetical protein VHV30_03945 [Polyangiaceae bacterium]|jgi:MYXO-CTERM domain-containing protein|nr:hypothetical protein [Polyangiaceae bacterium]